MHTRLVVALALLSCFAAAACSGNKTGAGSDAGLDCGWNNPSTCPPAPTTTAAAVGPCAPVGLTCTYSPGLEGTGCTSPTVLDCVDAGPDGGSWLLLQ